MTWSALFTLKEVDSRREEGYAPVITYCFGDLRLISAKDEDEQARIAGVVGKEGFQPKE